MNRKGVNYDVGIYPFGESRPSRRTFDPAIVRREVEIIRNDLHCNAIRIVGRDLERLVTAAQFAVDRGLEVWFSPAFHDADPAHTLLHDRMREGGGSTPPKIAGASFSWPAGS